MNLNLTPQARTIVYVTGLGIAALTVVALIILWALHLTDGDTVRDILAWVVSLSALVHGGVAVANRPTKPTP